MSGKQVSGKDATGNEGDDQPEHDEEEEEEEEEEEVVDPREKLVEGECSSQMRMCSFALPQIR
jgi:hypothetical protein